MRNKKTITIITILGLLILLLLTGCSNYDVLDTNYSYDYVECYISGEKQVYKIKQWKDYDGEQIQIRATNGNTYLLSMNYCMLVNED